MSLENIQAQVDVLFHDKKWKLFVYRRGDGAPEWTWFDTEREAVAAQTAVLQAIKEFRASNPGAVPRVEYKEIEIPLGIEGKSAAGAGIDATIAVQRAAMNAAGAASYKITAALNREGEDGWFSEGPTDLLSLLVAGRVGWKHSGGILMSWKVTFNHATVRLCRTNIQQTPATIPQPQRTTPPPPKPTDDWGDY